MCVCTRVPSTAPSTHTHSPHPSEEGTSPLGTSLLHLQHWKKSGHRSILQCCCCQHGKDRGTQSDGQLSDRGRSRIWITSNKNPSASELNQSLLRSSDCCSAWITSSETPRLPFWSGFKINNHLALWRSLLGGKNLLDKLSNIPLWGLQGAAVYINLHHAADEDLQLTCWEQLGEFPFTVWLFSPQAQPFALKWKGAVPT